MSTLTDKERLRAQLTTAGKPYEILGVTAGNCVRARFFGSFQGQEILWNACILTLEGIYQQALADRLPLTTALRQFIEVGALGDDGRGITIGLNLRTIDEPTVEKTMTMVRNYKRLGDGRIEWGTMIQPRPPRGGLQ